MTVVTRFAPSPTGFLHIGGARTALFNWLYAKHHGGEFKLRIEDTDRARSTQAAVDALIEGLRWLGLTWDGDIVYQFSRAARHAEVAHQLLAEGKAYYCYCTPEELEAMRAKAQAEKRGFRYDGRWRERGTNEIPAGIKPSIRLKMPLEGEITVKDKVQGEVRIHAKELDDMVILRSDGTPVYMLAVVVDDHDMGITHVIRGDDHLTNTFKQMALYEAMGWKQPDFSHIPLIHGADGAKLSKRHGALGADAYRDMGYLPEAMRNYLLRLGWGHGDDEIITTPQAIEWFDTNGIGKSPSRFDNVKLENLNGHYIREAENSRLVADIIPFIEKQGYNVSAEGKARLLRGMNGLKMRAKTLLELADNALIYILQPLPVNEKAMQSIMEGQVLLTSIYAVLEKAPIWEEHALQEYVKSHAEATGEKLGTLAGPLRASLSGRNISPSVFDMMAVLGREESLHRIRKHIKI